MSFNWLQDNGIFLPMINDTGRNIAYKAWLQSCASNKVICDIGAGTGMLSVLACQAGAKKVFAVEKDKSRFDFLKSTVDKINLKNKIEVINDDYLNTDINADYFITETFGNGIFDENILDIAEHKRNTSTGILIPETIEIFIKVYQSHPIFAVLQRESDADGFQPDIELDSGFYEIVNSASSKFINTNRVKFRSNWINNLFKELPKFTDLKLTEIYKSESIIVDLNKPLPLLQINIPANINGQFCLFWKASFNEIVMDVTDTIWSTPTRYINTNIKGVQVTFEKHNFNPEGSWWFKW